VCVCMCVCVCIIAAVLLLLSLSLSPPPNHYLSPMRNIPLLVFSPHSPTHSPTHPFTYLLPLVGMVGELSDEGDNKFKHLLYTHKSLSLAYNGNRVIEVNLTSSAPVEVEVGKPVHFTYSVVWKPTEVKFHDRFDKYLDLPFFEHQIHWFSIFNSFMMVVFLVGLVSMILIRALKKDYARFSEEQDEYVGANGGGTGALSLSTGDLGDDSGWKQVHGEVFRQPSHLVLFSALVGTGHQLVILVFCMLFLAMLGTYYRTRGTAATAFIVCYAFTSFVAGYSAGGYYSRNSGRNWIKCMLLTAGLFPGMAVAVGLVLNMVAHSYQSLSYVPFGTMVGSLLVVVLFGSGGGDGDGWIVSLFLASFFPFFSSFRFSLSYVLSMPCLSTQPLSLSLESTTPCTVHRTVDLGVPLVSAHISGDHPG
jgi:Endomembrane protein 70